MTTTQHLHPLLDELADTRELIVWRVADADDAPRPSGGPPPRTRGARTAPGATVAVAGPTRPTWPPRTRRTPPWPRSRAACESGVERSPASGRLGLQPAHVVGQRVRGQLVEREGRALEAALVDDDDAGGVLEGVDVARGSVALRLGHRARIVALRLHAVGPPDRAELLGGAEGEVHPPGDPPVDEEAAGEGGVVDVGIGGDRDRRDVLPGGPEVVEGAEDLGGGDRAGVLAGRVEEGQHRHPAAGLALGEGAPSSSRRRKSGRAGAGRALRAGEAVGADREVRALVRAARAEQEHAPRTTATAPRAAARVSWSRAGTGPRVETAPARGPSARQ